MKSAKVQIGNAAARLLVCLTPLLAGSSFAATLTWTNSAGDKLLGTAANWSPAAAPAPGDTIQWNGTASGSLTLTNGGALADSNPGLNVNVLAGQTSPLTIVENVGNSGRIRLNTSFVVENGAGPMTFGSSDTPALPLALGATGNGSVHAWTNNSANPVTINTNCFFLMGGGGSHTLSLAGAGDFILNTTIQAQNSGGNLNLTVNGSGTVTLVGTPTPGISFAGSYAATVLNGGTLRLADPGALGTSTLTINGGNLDSTVADLVSYGNNVQSWNGNFGFLGTQNLNLGYGNVTLNASRVVTVNAKTLEVDGVISGSGYSLTKAGAGTLVLGGVNTYSGGTVVSNGVLKLGNAGALGAGGANLTVHGTLDLNGSSPVVGNLSGNAAGVIDDAAAAGFDTLTVSSSGNSVFNGSIKNTTGTVSLTKDGSGTLTLGGANTYSGATAVNAGTLLANGSLGGGAVTVANGATLGGTNSIGGTVDWQSGSAALFTVTPTTAISGSNATPLQIAGSVTLNDNNLTINVAGATPLPPGTYRLMTYNAGGSTGSFATGAPTFTGAGVQAGTASTVTTSGGTVTLTVALTGVNAVWTSGTSGNWSTAANWSSNPNTPHVAGDGAILGVGAAYTTVTLDTPVSLGLIQFTNDNSFLIADAGNPLTLDNKDVGAAISVNGGMSNTIAPAVALNDNLGILTTAGTSLKIAGAMGNSSGARTVSVNGPGTVTLSGNNTYGPASAGSVGTILGGGGVLQLDNANAIGAGDLSVASSATVRVGAALTLANNIIAGAGTATVDDNANNVTLAGVISGGGALGKNGTGTLSLSSSNSYSGDTSIGAGTLKLLNAGGIAGGPGHGNVNLGAGASLDLNGNSAVLGGLNSTFADAAVDSLAGGAVTLTVGANGAFSTFAGRIQNTSGSLTVVKEGTGVQTLSGTNTYTGGTVINAGTLQIGSGGTTGSLGSGTLVDNGNLSFNLAADVIFADQITGTGSVSLANAALKLRLYGNNTFTGPVNLTYGNAGALWFTNGNALGVGPKVVTCNVPNASLHLNGISGDINVDSSINFTLSGTSGVLFNEAGSNTISGPVDMIYGNGNPKVVVNSGFLTLAGTVSAVNPRTLILGGAGAGLVSGAIVDAGGAGAVTKEDAGTWILAGDNTYSGATAVNAGTLLVNGNNYGAGAVTVAANTVFGGTGSVASAITWQANSKGRFAAAAGGATPLTVYGNVTLNNNPIEIHVDGGTPLPPGQYTLLLEGNTAIYTISGSFQTTPIITGAGIQAGTIAAVSSSATEVKLVVANSSTWTFDGNGNWSTGANWSSNPNFPDTPGEFALLGVGSSQISINLDASETIGGLSFTNDHSFVITSAVNTLTFDNGGVGAGISVLAGTGNVIAAKVSLADATSISTASNASLAISGNVDGFSGISLGGSGTVSLSGANTYTGDTALSGGTLILGSSTAIGSGALTLAGGSLDSSVPNLVVANANPQNWNGSFTFLGSQNLNLGAGAVTAGTTEKTVTVNSNSLTVGGVIYGTARLTKAGSGALVLLAANGDTLTGGFRISGGPVVIGDNAALGSGTIEFASGDAAIQSSDSTARTLTNSMNLSFGGIYAGTGNLTFTGPLASGSFPKTWVVSNAVTTFSGVLAGGTSQNAANTKAGPGKLILSGDNSTLAKMLAVNEGTLALGSATALGTGAFTLNGGGLDSTVADLVNTGNNPQAWNGSFYFAGTENLNLGTGAVALGANVTVTVSNKTLTVGGAVTGAGYGLTKAGAGTLLLNGTNDYGNTTVAAGTLAIAQATLRTNSAVAVATNAALRLDFSTTNQVAQLVLGGVSQPDGIYGSTTPGGYLAGTGSLRVQHLGPSGPVLLTNSVSGSTLSLSWPAGQGWRLQKQTNSLATGLSTNWVDVGDGSLSSTNLTIDPTQPTVFYRLVNP